MFELRPPNVAAQRTDLVLRQQGPFSVSETEQETAEEIQMKTRKELFMRSIAFYGLEDTETVMEAVSELGDQAFTQEGLARIAQLQRDKEQRLFAQAERRRRWS